MKHSLPMLKYHFIILLSFFAVAKIGVTHAGDWLANPYPIASQNNLLKYKCSMGRGITGTPIAIQPVGSMPNCAYMCRRHLQCRSATFWGNQTCHLHSKTSAQGTFYTNQAIVIDFLEQNSTHILITGDARMMEFIPEVKVVKYLNTDLSIPRRQHVAVLYDGNIIIDGGRSPGSGSPIESTVALSGVPIVQEETNAISYKHMFGCGGLVNDKLYHCFGQDDTNALSHCDIYDLANGYAHSSFDTGLPARYGNKCLFKDNRMYVIGGKIPLIAGNTNGVYKIDLSNKNVTPLKNLPIGIAYHSAVWYKGKIVICGGQKYDGGTHTYTNLCYKYVLTIDNWGTFPSMKVGRYTHASVIWGWDKILVIGGNDGLQGLSSIEVYEGGVWSMFAEMPQGLMAMQVTNLDQE